MDCARAKPPRNPLHCHVLIRSRPLPTPPTPPDPSDNMCHVCVCITAHGRVFGKLKHAESCILDNMQNRAKQARDETLASGPAGHRRQGLI